MKLIDTHSHLYLEDFAGDMDSVIQRAREAGLTGIYLPNIDGGTLEDMNALVKKAPKLFHPMLGLHPTSVQADFREGLEKLFNDADFSEYSAIGEIGIDLYWDKTYKREQEEAFRFQVGIAKDKGLPIVIHARDSFREIFSIIDELNDDQLFGIFHCFTGSKADAEHIISYGGFKLGIGGVVTFKNGGLDKVLPTVPLKHIVLETDSPYLAPAPHRGKRNESAYIRLVADRLAEIYQMDVEEVARVTSHNAEEIFRT